jgi:Helix-turn-helix domain of resolvase
VSHKSLEVVLGRPSKLDPSQLRALRRKASRSTAYRAPATQIASEFGVSRATFYRLLKAGNVRRRRLRRSAPGKPRRHLPGLSFSPIFIRVRLEEVPSGGYLLVRRFMSPRKKVLIRQPQDFTVLGRRVRRPASYDTSRRFPRVSSDVWVAMLGREANAIVLKRLRLEQAARTLDRVFPAPRVLTSQAPPQVA